MSDSRLEAFLARIYVDESARARFLVDPRGEATNAGLSAEQVEAMLRIDRDGLELFAHSLKKKKQGHR